MVSKVYFFGSHEKGTERPDSDWDFLVITRGDFDRATKMRAISGIQKALAIGENVTVDILMRSECDLPEIDADAWCVSRAATKEGIL